MTGRRYSHDRRMLRISPCEHGKTLTIVGVYEGDPFIDPNCRTKDGKMRQHVASADKYDVDPDWIADVEEYERAVARMAKAREAKKS